MRYGTDDNSGQDLIREAQKRSRRYVQLMLMSKQQLVRLYGVTKTTTGSDHQFDVDGSMTRKKDDYATAIIRMENGEA